MLQVWSHTRIAVIEGMLTMPFKLLAIAAVLSSAAAQYSAQQPSTTLWNERNGKGLAYNSDTSLYPFASRAQGNQPEQISVTYQDPTSVVLNWVTGQAQVYNSTSGAVVAPSTTGVQSLVQYAPRNATAELNATGFATTYTQGYNLGEAGTTGGQNNYTSGIINHVALTNLLPSTLYYYRVGDGKNWSLPSTFTTLQAVNGVNFQPYRMGVVADIGITENSTTTIQHLTESLPDVVTLIGDWCYADNLLTNGTISGSVNYTGPEQTYQTTWDQFSRLWGTLTSRVPFFAVAGNHEYEQQASGATYTSYNARYNQTSDLSKSGNSRYYSIDLPGMHFINLSPYDDYNTTSAQYAWLQKDLASFNRTRTPWLVAQWHAPIYNTYVSHYKEVECARLVWEPLLMKYGVDLVMHGHVHSYERTNRVFNYQVNPCAPMYITIGDAGNLEQLAVPMADQPGMCPAIKFTSSPGSKFQGNCQWYNFQPENANSTNGGFCPTQQPAWSAFREPSFGHGTLDVSPFKLLWSWHRNQDAEPVVTDTYTILQKDSTCANLNQPLNYLPSAGGLAPSPAPAAATVASVAG